MMTWRRAARGIKRRAERAADRLLRRSWRLTYNASRRRFLRAHPNRESKILILQMGRVGSRSLSTALEARAGDATVYHVHFLSDGEISRTRSHLREQYEVTGVADIPDQFLAAEVLNQELEGLDRGHVEPRQRWKVVSLVRDPLVRHVSAFFQFFQTFFPHKPAGFRTDPANVPELTELFVQGWGQDREFMAAWFDNEIRGPLGIDVFSAPFPRDRGFQIMKGPFADLLVLRLEDAEATAPVAMREFLGLERFEVPRVNIGARKAYGDAYRAFRESALLPGWLLDEVYGSKLALHFYSPEELDAFRQAWLRNGAD